MIESDEKYIDNIHKKWDGASSNEQLNIIRRLGQSKIGSPKALPALTLAQHSDTGTDYEGRKVSDIAARAIQQIKDRQNDDGSDVSDRN